MGFWGFRVLGFEGFTVLGLSGVRVLSFRVLGFRVVVLGFRVLRFKASTAAAEGFKGYACSAVRAPSDFCLGEFADRVSEA